MNEIARSLRQHNINLYLSSLFVRQDKREHVQALFAFATEMARIADQVSEPHLAEIRLQWWLDTLDAIYHHEPQAHPLAQSLAKAIYVGDIPKYALVSLAKAHQFDFYSDPMPSMNDLEGYLGETQGGLIKMAAMILDKDDALEVGEACGLAGVAYGLVHELNNLPKARRLQQNFIPKDVLAKRGLVASQIYDSDFEASMMVVLAELRQHVSTRLAQLSRISWTIKESVAPAFMHITLTKPILAKAQRLGTGVLSSGCEISQLHKQWVLWRSGKSDFF